MAKAVQNRTCPACGTTLADPEFEGIADHPSYYPGDITHGEVYKYLGRNIYGQFDEIFTNVKSK